jgi:hypothetical protein
MGELKPDSLDIPASLLRDANNKAEFQRMASDEVEVESRPAKTKVKATTKANGVDKAPVKAAGKPVKKVAKAAVKAKTAPKATARAAKAPIKAKATKPKAAGKVDKDAWGFRKGSAKSKAVAMYTRKSGATLEEVKAVVGSVQLNVLNKLEEDGAKIKRVKEQRDGQRPVTRYYLQTKV